VISLVLCYSSVLVTLAFFCDKHCFFDIYISLFAFLL